MPAQATEEARDDETARIQRHQRAHGLGRIAFVNGTTLAELYQEGAAKIRLPRTTSGMPAEAILINTAGGLTGGDKLAWQIDAGPGTKVAITTQACERIYRSLDGAPAAVEARMSLGPGARLDWLPQETILFNRSALRRSLDVNLAMDSTFLAVEAVVFGRHAMGESVAEAHFHDRWRIRRAGRLIFADDVRFQGTVSRLLDRATIAGGGKAFASIVFVAPDAELRLGALRGLDPEFAASAFNGKLLARLIAGDAYDLRKRLVPALEKLSVSGSLPKAWAL